MSEPLNDGFVPFGDFGYYIRASDGGEEWSYLDGPDPRKTEKDWSAFDPQHSNLTPVSSVLAAISDSPSPEMRGRS
jgi:hypothetical protein